MINAQDILVARRRHAGRRLRVTMLGLFAALCAVVHADAQTTGSARHDLISNFSYPFHGSAEFVIESDPDDKQVGLASARIAYKPAEGRNQAVLKLEKKVLRARGSGTIRVWVKGDGSPNRLHLDLSSSVANRRNLGRWTIPLDDSDWKEFSHKIEGVGGNAEFWVASMTVELAGKPEEQTREGEFRLDDMRIYRQGGPSSIVRLAFAGDLRRSYTTNVHFNLELRNFSREAFRTDTRIRMHDRRRNLVAERRFDIVVAPNESREMILAFDPENLEVFVPPFTVSGELISPDNPDVDTEVEETLVMGNSYLLFDDFGDVFGRWFVSGTPFNLGQNNGVLFGEQQHADARMQTNISIRRVNIPDAEQKAVLGQHRPGPGRFAMQIDYTGNAMIFNGLHRFLPGDPYRMGIWVKGDASGARLSAAVMDFTQAGSTSYTWKRHFNWKVPLCTLDFTGWQYVEVPLPGNGIGERSIRGSTDGIDYPLDLSALILEAPRRAKEEPPFVKGSVQIGAVYLHTQQSSDDTLAVEIAYDDVNHEYAPKHGAWITVQNGWRVGTRGIDLEWILLDRADEVVARGRQGLELAAMRRGTARVEFAPHADKMKSRTGPFRMQVTVFERQGSGVGEAQLIIAKPDSLVHFATFDMDRGYLGLKALGVKPEPAKGAFVTRTTTAQKHSGSHSLELNWKQSEGTFVSVDPPLPGIPVELSLWVYGDGSGVLFYPLIGDQFGVISDHGLSQWDLFLPRTESGPLQNAVRVDWKGWRELKFRLPIVPPSWNDDTTVHPFTATYPLGLHLSIDTRGVTGAGKLYVDDVRVRTHLADEERLALRFEGLGESNLILPGSALHVDVSNWTVAGGGPPRKAKLTGGIYDWAGRRVAPLDRELTLAPGRTERVEIASKLPRGAFRMKIRLQEGESARASLAEDLLVLDPSTVLGAGWRDALKSETQLRRPLRDRFEFINHDWDWAEFQPGNLQPDTILEMIMDARRDEFDPYVILGYSAFWASGIGYEDLIDGNLPTRSDRTPGARWWGGTVDIFHIPERMDDWENYCREMMQLVGPSISGWIAWDSPDSRNGSLKVPAPKFAEMLEVADRWRLRYAPDTPILIGGMSRGTAASYIRELAAADALNAIDGAVLRLDAGRLSPEDAQIPEYVDDLRLAMMTKDKPNKTIVVSDLDWVVEREGKGLDAFDQAAFLSRASILLSGDGVHHVLMLRNKDAARLGQGLTYKKSLSIPPMTQKLPSYYFKPGWWAAVRTRDLLEKVEVSGMVDLSDLYPGRTMCILAEQKADKKPIALIWRNNEPGSVSFADTGCSADEAEDIFGSPVVAKDGWYVIGKIPTVFVLRAGSEPPLEALRRLRTRDQDGESAWPQRVLASFTPGTGGAVGYTHTGAEKTVVSGKTADGRRFDWPALAFSPGGVEKFTLKLPSGSGLVLRKRYFLDQAGQEADVRVNGQSIGTWDLKRSVAELSQGLRRAAFVVPASALAGAAQAEIAIHYKSEANTAGWDVMEYAGGAFPLSAMGAIHADSKVAPLRHARNVVGHGMRVGEKDYTAGIGVHAKHFLEYPLNGQFTRFTAQVGVDAVTKGKGTVVFEVYADGKQVWTSTLMDGLAPAKSIDLDVSKVNRLRLLVNDADDGEDYDAANWCNPQLHM